MIFTTLGSWIFLFIPWKTPGISSYACFSIYSEKLINWRRIPFRNKMAETSNTRRTALLSTPTDLKISRYSNFFLFV